MPCIVRKCNSNGQHELQDAGILYTVLKRLHSEYFNIKSHQWSVLRCNKIQSKSKAVPLPPCRGQGGEDV